MPLIRAATQANVPLRTAQRWLARYRHDGLVGLASAGCRDAGHSLLPADLMTLIEGMALRRPRSSAAAIHRRATAIAEAQGWRIPSYSTVDEILARFDPAMVILALDGSAAFRDRYELSIATQRSRSALWQRCWLKISLQRVAICLDVASVSVCSLFVLS